MAPPLPLGGRVEFGWFGWAMWKTWALWNIRLCGIFGMPQPRRFVVRSVLSHTTRYTRMRIELEPGDEPVTIANEDGRELTISVGKRGELEITTKDRVGIEFGEVSDHDEVITVDNDEEIVALLLQDPNTEFVSAYK